MRPEEQRSFTVDSFRPEDAEGIVSLFRAVYGEHYPIRLFYDPEALTQANREGRYYSIVARGEREEIIGATHIYRSAPYRNLYEWGAGLVLKEYRKLGVNGLLEVYVNKEFVPANSHIEAVFGEAVCNHPYMQRCVSRQGYMETAVEVALMPVEAYSREKSAPSRVATLNVFRSFIPKPHRLFLPPAYEAILQRIYGRLDDARDLSVAEEKQASDPITQAEVAVFDFARVARITTRKTGMDFLSRFSELEDEARKKGVVVFQAWLNLAEPEIGETVNRLRDRGYFFGGVFPRWFDTDSLLMQKLECPPDFENIVLYTDFSKELLSFIREDREQVLRRQTGV